MPFVMKAAIPVVTVATLAFATAETAHSTPLQPPLVQGAQPGILPPVVTDTTSPAPAPAPSTAPSPMTDQEAALATSAAAATPTGPRTSPFDPQPEDDHHFVVDDAPGLDTGYTFRSGGPSASTFRSRGS